MNASLGKGELILGQVDKIIFVSDISYVPLAKERKFEVLVDKVTFVYWKKSVTVAHN